MYLVTLKNIFRVLETNKHEYKDIFMNLALVI